MRENTETRARTLRALILLCVTCLLVCVLGCANNTASSTSAGSDSLPVSPRPQVNDAGVDQGGSSSVEPSDEEVPVTINLFAAGDVVVHKPVWQSGALPDGSYEFSHLFAHVTDEVQAADVALISQETILGGTELGLSGYPTFNGPQEIGDAEVAAGFDVMLKATNHVLDKGEQGIERELEFWHTLHPEIAVVGMSTNEEDYRSIYVYEQDGFKVALLTYTYDTNGLPFPEGNPWATHLFNDDEIRNDVARAHELADLVVVWPHWGTEYQADPDDFQRYYAQLFCDVGVDVVIGSHPHTLCPVEVKQRDDGHQTLVFYSLGNYLSNQTEGVMTSVGAQVRLTLVKDEQGARVADWTLEPTVTQRGSGSDFAVWRLSDYTDELAAANFTQLTRQGCEDWCTQVLGENYDQATSTLSGTL